MYYLFCKYQSVSNYAKEESCQPYKGTNLNPERGRITSWFDLLLQQDLYEWILLIPDFLEQLILSTHKDSCSYNYFPLNN